MKWIFKINWNFLSSTEEKENFAFCNTYATCVFWVKRIVFDCWVFTQQICAYIRPHTSIAVQIFAAIVNFFTYCISIIIGVTPLRVNGNISTGMNRIQCARKTNLELLKILNGVLSYAQRIKRVDCRSCSVFTLFFSVSQNINYMAGGSKNWPIKSQFLSRKSDNSNILHI